MVNVPILFVALFVPLLVGILILALHRSFESPATEFILILLLNQHLGIALAIYYVLKPFGIDISKYASKSSNFLPIVPFAGITAVVLNYLVMASALYFGLVYLFL